MPPQQGWVRVWRKLFENKKIWDQPEPYTKRDAWVWLLGNAAGTEFDHKTKYGVYHLKRGELVVSYRELSERWRWSRSKVVRYLNRLSKGEDPELKVRQLSAQVAGQQSGHIMTHLTIIKYNDYNGERDTKRDTKRDSERDNLRDKIKNIEELLKDIRSSSTTSPHLDVDNSKPTPQEIQNEWIERVRYVWKNNFNQEIEPRQINMLVYGSKRGRKCYGFKSYQALAEWIAEMKDKKLTGSVFAYCLTVAKTQQGVWQYQKRASGKQDFSTVGDVLEKIRKDNLEKKG